MRSLGDGDGHPAGECDRGLREVAHELRAVGTGAIVLLGFLFCISFSGRFAGLSDVQLAMYITAIVFACVAAGMLLAPALCLRLVLERRVPEQVLAAVNSTAAYGLAAAGLAMGAAVRLASRWAEPRLAADLLGAGTAGLVLTIWLVAPWLRGRYSQPARSGPSANGASRSEGARN